MEVLNERAFRQLIKMYKSITVKDMKSSLHYDKLIDKVDLSGFLSGFTGFGDTSTCILCRATFERICGMMMPNNCDSCLYTYTTDESCSGGINAITYRRLTSHNCSPITAIRYIRSRVNYMLSVYGNYLRKVIDETEIELNNIVCDGDDSYSDNAGNQIEYILQLERKLKCFEKKLEIINGKSL